MKYYIIAGEASGDLHGSNLVKEIKKIDTSCTFRGWGGDLMEDAGVTIVKHYRELAFMGFTEVLLNLRTILKNLSFCRKDILQFKPDVVILVDYPGFNLRIAEWAKKQDYKTVFYISPQVWAWKESRVPKMKKFIDKMLVILPFEKEYFNNKWNWKVTYVGHPLVEVIENFKNHPQKLSINQPEEKEIVAILPGSRKQEILIKLPIMLQATKTFKHIHFVVAKAPSLDDEFYENLLTPYPNVSAVRNETYALMNVSKAAMVTSGTATLETALFGVPQVVCYKGGSISYQIAKRLIKVKYISLVNLIMDKPVVTELIQHDLTVDNLVKELEALLNNSERQSNIKKDYGSLKEILFAGGNASQAAAEIITQFAANNPNQYKEE